jgi:alkaline phosphatase D
MDRRVFLHAVGGSALIAATGRLAAQTIAHNPFTLGVASGSPSVDGFVLWTRLMAAAGGEPLPNAPIEVRWELATDAQFKRIVQSGAAIANPELAHSVHIEVAGLSASNARYWYRFMLADAVSTVGRTRTLPPLASTERLTLALLRCLPPHGAGRSGLRSVCGRLYL